jgi:hypothetical protein
MGILLTDFNDSELDDRLKCIETTNKRIKEGLEVSGYKGLESIMEKQDIDKLKKLVRVVNTKTSKSSRRKMKSEDDEEEDEGGKNKKKTQLQIIDEILESSGEEYIYFKDQFGQYYIRVNNKEIIELDTKDADGRIYEYLRSICRNSQAYPNFRPNVESLNTIIKDFRVSCTESNLVYNLDVRIAKDPNIDYVLHYDLIDEKFNIVTITPNGWSIGSNSPPIFKRHIGLNSKQVEPLHDDDNNSNIFQSLFDKLINTNDLDLKHIIKVYVIGCFIPDIMRPIFTVVSDQDSGKTTLAHKIQDLVDPTTSSKLKLSNSSLDNSQTFSQMYYTFFDNINKRITDSQSQDLCLAVTGGSEKKKKLYTDAGNYVFSYDKRAVSYTSTKIRGTQSDLLDRSLLITELEPINATNRLKESQIIKEYEKSKPYMLGYIFDTLAQVLKLKQQMDQEGKTLECINKNNRLLDFAEYGELISIVLGNEEGYFSKIYDKILSKRTIEVLNNNTIGRAIMELMDDLPLWTGDPTTFHMEIKNIVMDLRVKEERQLEDEYMSEDFYFPSEVRAFMKEVYKLSPLLKMQEIIITALPPRNSQRKIEIRNLRVEKDLRRQKYNNENQEMEQVVKKFFDPHKSNPVH